MGQEHPGNKVALERIIKRVWRVISYGKLDTCKSISYFESSFFYFIEAKLYKIMTFDCHPYLLKIINLQDEKHEDITRLSVCNYNVLFYSKSKRQQSFLYQTFYLWNTVSLYFRNRDFLKIYELL